MKTKEEEKERKHKYYLANKQKIIHNAALWAKNNPERYAENLKRTQNKPEQKIKSAIRRKQHYLKNRKPPREKKIKISKEDKTLLKISKYLCN